MNSSNETPTLKSHHLLLEPITLKDAEGVFDFASHEQVAKTVTWEAHASIEDSKNYIRSVLKRISVQPGEFFLCWVVRSLESKKVIGLVTLTETSSTSAQLGYVFHYDHWNRVEPMEALASVLHYSSGAYPRFHRVQARCFPTNTVSRSLLSALGFHFEGINRGLMRVRGQFIDLTCYSTLQTQWKELTEFNLFKTEAAEHI